MAEIVEEFGLISFMPLDISSAESVGRVLAKIDKCNGYVFTQQAKNSSNTRIQSASNTKNSAEDIFQCAIQAEPSNYETIADIQERLAMGRQQNRQNKER